MLKYPQSRSQKSPSLVPLALQMRNNLQVMLDVAPLMFDFLPKGEWDVDTHIHGFGEAKQHVIDYYKLKLWFMLMANINEEYAATHWEPHFIRSFMCLWEMERESFVGEYDELLHEDCLYDTASMLAVTHAVAVEKPSYTEPHIFTSDGAVVELGIMRVVTSNVVQRSHMIILSHNVLYDIAQSPLICASMAIAIEDYLVVIAIRAMFEHGRLLKNTDECEDACVNLGRWICDRYGMPTVKFPTIEEEGCRYGFVDDQFRSRFSWYPVPDELTIRPRVQELSQYDWKMGNWLLKFCDEIYPQAEVLTRCTDSNLHAAAIRWAFHYNRCSHLYFLEQSRGNHMDFGRDYPRIRKHLKAMYPVNAVKVLF